MKKYIVRDLMVPIEEYASVPLGTTLYGAMLALEDAQENFDHGKYQHRAILVLDENKKVVGRISQLRTLKAMEATHNKKAHTEQLKMYKFSEAYIAKKCEEARLECKVFTKKVLEEASKKLVDDFMQKPTPSEYVAEDSELDLAMHKMVAGAHQSLLVTRNEEIVGVLRLADIFTASFQAMKELDTP